MNKETSIQIVFFLVMMLLVSTVFLATHKPSQGTQDNGGFLPDQEDWRPALASDTKSASQTIVAQLKAFDRNDYVAAAELEAPGIVHSSREPEELKRIVQAFYPEFAHYKSVQFKEARSNPGRNEMSIHIVLTGKDNYTVDAFYRITVIGGRYLVAGVRGGDHPGRAFFQRHDYRPGPGHPIDPEGPGPT